ncbi:hypothetical protein FHX42_003547 [Saccharopolyspora lacisalsi]|uniref:Uncharacterized protein n=1 Tax=Halosaccharopolyspora lacisalsi TaxID=1000566 RepID=A0A839E487_9PSEU|nr:hypothetical protein [Halosaccharopolyspora lacisalsi]MBA8826171.1 hypothetical protein [Halosaccharopolyspora lacisalsi]
MAALAVITGVQGTVDIGTSRREVGPRVPQDWELTGSGGPRPFVTWRTYRLPDQSSYLWESRHHRKGVGPRTYPDRLGLRTRARGEDHSTKSPWLRFWAPHRLAWWIATIFVVGSVCFVAGAAGSLVPGAFGGHHRMSLFAETCYFVGATLYTVSIYGQILETLNADRAIGPDRRSHAPERFRWFAFELRHLEFLVPFVLFLGSLVFNYETIFALGSSLNWLPELGLWTTSLLGAVLFLVSGFLQFIEAGHGYVSFDPRNVSWWVGVLFVIGSVGFVIGALPGLGTPGLPTSESYPGALIVKIGFLVGGVAYLAGSYLMLPELFTQLREHGRKAS